MRLLFIYIVYCAILSMGKQVSADNHSLQTLRRFFKDLSISFLVMTGNPVLLCAETDCPPPPPPPLGNSVAGSWGIFWSSKLLPQNLKYLLCNHIANFPGFFF